jgi:hypothetical protein
MPRPEYYRMPSRSNYRSDANMHPLSLIGSCLFLLALVLWPVISFITAHQNNSVQTITVTSKDDQATGSNGHQYLIFTPTGVFKDTDNLWLGKFNSSDVYNGLQVHHRYTCKIHGTRNHFSSNYPDIMSCQPA